MRQSTLAQIASVVEAKLVGGDGDTLVTGANVDSRTVRDGDLFFALTGETDGTDYASHANDRGASATVASLPLDVPTLVVEDPQSALAKLARWNLETDRYPFVVGITGSMGKTTTKDALATILRFAGKRVSATEGNFNNEIGLPLTVLAAPEATEILVLEMGATHKGDIKHLCDVAPPSVGILTAIAPVHLDSFGSIEALAAAKGELAMCLPEDGSFVYPNDVPEAARGAGRSFGKSFAFTGEGEADLWASEVEEREDGLRFTVNYGEESAEVRTPAFGTHLISPLLGAIGGALALGLTLEECAAGLTRLKRTGLRGEVYKLRDDIVIYDDSYNASPVAMSAVLRYGATHAESQGRRLVAVLGGMFELGGGAREYHREIGALSNEVGVDLLLCVGDEARWYAEAFSGDSSTHSNAEEAADALQEALRPGDYVIVKGSRGVKLDILTRKLRERLALV